MDEGGSLGVFDVAVQIGLHVEHVLFGDIMLIADVIFAHRYSHVR